MRFLFFIFSILAVAASCKTAAQPASTATIAAVAETENALLWEISGKGIKQPSYLFGTIHMIGKEDFFLSESTRSALEKAQKVVFEINMEDMMDFSKLMPLMMKAFMPGDTTLKDLLDEEDYGMVRSHFEKLGLPMILLDRIKPMFLSVLSSDDILSFDEKSGNVVSYEMELMKIAKAGNKEIDGLETAEFQMSMFDSIPYKVQAGMLVESIKAGDAGQEQFAQMVELYKNQDLKGMQEMLEGEQGGLGEYDDILLVGRNKNWIPVMQQIMKQGPTFFAVGAGHLGGENGVVALLRKEGFTVRAVK